MCNTTQTTGYSLRKNVLPKQSHSLLTQGVHSIEEYEALCSANVYPLNLLSQNAIEDFGNGLFFSSSGVSVVIGWKRGKAYEELSNVQYVQLIQLVAGINPRGRAYGMYKADPSKPTLPCAFNMRPCYREPGPGCLCTISYDNECCFIRDIQIASSTK